MASYDKKLGTQLGQREIDPSVIKQTQSDLESVRQRRDAPKEYEQKVFKDNVPSISVGSTASPSAMSTALTRQAQKSIGANNSNRLTNFRLQQPIEDFSDLARGGNQLAQQESIRNQNIKQQLAYQQQRKALFDAKKREDDAIAGKVLASILGLGAFIFTAGAASPLIAAGVGTAVSKGTEMLGAGQQGKTPLEEIK